MHNKTLEDLLGRKVPQRLAKDLVQQFVQLRQDVASQTLGRSAPGKFVETFVQVLQYLDAGSFEERPSVDEYLKNIESKAANLSDGLRICGSRIARSMYTLRNKRNILHKGDVDPNLYDLRYLLAATQWLLAELVRELSGHSMQAAGALVEKIQTPVLGLVEDFGHRKLVFGDLKVKEEILVLLHSNHPNPTALQGIVSNLDRRNPKSVRNAVRALWSEKLIEGSSEEPYRLTALGLRRAVELLAKSAV